jgi:hypothetical protein
MGILQIADHMVCSTFRHSLFFISTGVYLNQKCTAISECAYCTDKRPFGITLPFLSNKNVEYRCRQEEVDQLIQFFLKFITSLADSSDPQEETL